MEEDAVLLDVVEGIVECFLDGHPDDLVKISSEEQADEIIEHGKDRLKLVWIDDVDDPIFLFWRLMKAEKLENMVHIIITGAKDSPSWRDLANYECVKFGSLFLMICDNRTAPSIVPSQRGIFRGEES